MFSPLTILIATLGGIIPALIWLAFWLGEDERRPEPRGRIFITFLAGMLAVVVVLPLEHLVQEHIPGGLFTLFLLWAIIEETLKFVFAYFAGLHNKDCDEPVDALIYMITAALGFAALENTLFLLTPIEDGLIGRSIVTGNMRFIGASVLHTLASGVVGAAMAFSFYRAQRIKRRYVLGGLILAIALHTYFNFSIIGHTNVLVVFAYIWVGVILLLMIFEKVKHIRRSRS
ncbi:MAG: PrsW family glutamic-type intramembrane protease [Candidatus Paceibacterota bacterium]